MQVFARGDMDWPEGAPRTPAKWFAQEPDGKLHGFMLEDAACEFQRLWRDAHGLNPMTGEKMMPQFTIELTEIERDGVIAALRLWQCVDPYTLSFNERYMIQAIFRYIIQAIFTNGGKHEPLSGEQIDALCERLSK